MRKTTKPKGKGSPSTPAARSARVGIAEFRGNLATYLERARSGQPIIIQERGRNAYVLSSFVETAPATTFGCMRTRTEYLAGSIVNARESWAAGEMP